MGVPAVRGAGLQTPAAVANSGKLARSTMKKLIHALERMLPSVPRLSCIRGDGLDKVSHATANKVTKSAVPVDLLGSRNRP